jgi:GNAT superfamily N-acetyltransferase
MDCRVWQAMDAQNIQIDPDARIRYLVSNSKRMGALFQEIRETITIQAEPFDVFWRDAQELLAAHYAEAGSFDGQPLDPNVGMARAMEASQQLLVMTARRGGAIVGYILFFINPSFESKNVLLGFQNIFYVKPEHRGTLGKKLRDRAISVLKERGVTALMLRAGVRARGPKLAALYEREGAKHLGALYCLPLED